jgi:hypothetical protein
MVQHPEQIIELDKLLAQRLNEAILTLQQDWKS